MTTYTATLPNGSTETRNSKRIYTHAVITGAFMNTRKGELETGGTGNWAGVLNWCGSEALAQKAADKARRGGPSGYWTEVQVIEVTEAN